VSDTTTALTSLPAAGVTVPELAKLLRVGQDKIRGWIKKGMLGAVNTASEECGTKRFVIMPWHLAEWEKRRNAGPAPKQVKSKKQTTRIDHYPD